MRDLIEMTAAELVELRDRLHPGNAMDGPWKRPKADLAEHIRTLGGADGTDARPGAVEDAAPGPRPVVELVRALLATDTD